MSYRYRTTQRYLPDLHERSSRKYSSTSRTVFGGLRPESDVYYIFVLGASVASQSIARATARLRNSNPTTILIQAVQAVHHGTHSVVGRLLQRPRR